MFDTTHYFGERSRTTNALRSMDAINDWPATIEHLMMMDDENSAA